MRTSKRISVSNVRLLRASAIVAAIILAAPCVNAFAQAFDADEVSAGEFPGLRSQDMPKDGGALAMADWLESVANPARVDVPQAFADEVGVLPGARDIRVDDAGLVVGYVVDGKAESVLAALDEHMRGNGWTCVSLGGRVGTTYLKDAGRCRWVLATCTQVDESTSVVMRCIYE